VIKQIKGVGSKPSCPSVKATCLIKNSKVVLMPFQREKQAHRVWQEQAMLVTQKV